MYEILLQLHSYLRYILLALLIVAIIISVIGLSGKKPYTRQHDKLSLFLLMCVHTQALVGVILYIVSATGSGRVQWGSETMGNSSLRYFAVEHAILMIIPVVLITIGRATSKKTAIDQQKHKKQLTFNSIALLIIIGVVYGMGRSYNLY